MAAISH